MKRPLITLVILTGVMLTACAAPAEKPEATPTPPPTLEVLAHWTGTGTKTTEPIAISETPWAIVWEFQPDEPLIEGMYANLLGVMVKRVGDDLYLKVPVNIVNVKKHKADSSYMYDEGTFYLEISSMGGTWDIQIVGVR